MRTFNATPARRERVPIWLGLFGPPGAGKTYSALRLATGIAAETGAKMFVIDTEARRALHYADDFPFQHIDMAPPFSAGDYLAAIEYSVGQGAGICIIDSQSHEHEGPGGYLDTHDAEVDRIAGDDWAKRQRANLQAWSTPSRNRQAMVNRLGQIGAHFIFCFRAKEKVKPEKKDGKSAIIDMGWQPISGLTLLYSMTVNMLLLPRSGGRPTWDSENPHERLMMKLPRQFESLFRDGRPLDEQHGRELARWAAGAQTQADLLAEYTDERVDGLLSTAAGKGMAALHDAWKTLPPLVQAKWVIPKDMKYKPKAAKMDEAIAIEEARDGAEHELS